MGFCYQENTRFSQAATCSREKFWASVRSTSTQWKIDARRDIIDVTARHDQEGIARWLRQTDYGKFLARKRAMKKESARQKFFAKTDEERLLAFAQELKESLVAFIFSCRAFDATPTAKGSMFCHRRLADCHLNGLVMLDIDHVEQPLAVFETLKGNEALMRRTALVHVTSSRKGIRIVFTADKQDGNLADNQIVFAEALGYKADQSCIDATRNSFAPKEDDILYINEALLFDYYDEEFDKRFTNGYREKRTHPLHHQFEAKDEKIVYKEQKDLKEVLSPAKAKEILESPQSLDNNAPSEIKWRGYDLQQIIDARYADKLPCAADSNRHAESLKLASDLLLMLDGDKAVVQQIVEAQPWVREIMDERDEDVAQTVESAAAYNTRKEGATLTPRLSKAMLEAIEQVKANAQSSTDDGQCSTVNGQCSMVNGQCSMVNENCPLDEWGAQIAAMFDDFPLLRDICRGLRPSQYPAALFVGGGLLMTLMTRCTYRFYHRPEELRRLNNSTLIIGDPAAGKSFATRLYKLITVPIAEADQVGKDAINAYRELLKTKGANKDKSKKPRVTIRIHPARTSNAQFIQDMVNAVEDVDGVQMQLHMLTFDTELDNTLALQRGGAYIDKQALELKAFHNEEDGQFYANVDSVVQNFNVYWNYIYTGTPLALKRKVNEQNFGTGLATRLTCIPLPPTNFEMLTRERDIDNESDERLTMWARRLDRTKGELSVQHIVDELYEWTARRMADAKDNDSRADEMLLKRCAYHGLNFAAPFIVMRHWDAFSKDGELWSGTFETDDTDWRLAELIVNMQYACQRHFFGALAEAYFDNKLKDASANVQHRQKTVEGFNRLPEEFTAEDVMRCFGMSNVKSASAKVSRLMKDHLIEKSETFIANGTMKAKYRKIL